MKKLTTVIAGILSLSLASAASPIPHPATIISESGRQYSVLFKKMEQDTLRYDHQELQMLVQTDEDRERSYQFYPIGKGNSTVFANIEISADDWKSCHEADAFRLSGKFNEATKRYAALVKNNPTWWYLYENLGTMAYFEGNYAAAMDWCRKGIGENPLSAGLHTVMGDCYRQLGNDDSAMKEYYEAIITDRNDPVPWQRLGEILSFSGKRLRDLRFPDVNGFSASGDTIEVLIDKNLNTDNCEMESFLMYALADAVWEYDANLVEPDSIARKNKMARPLYTLGCLLGGYVLCKSETTGVSVPYIDLINEISEADYFSQFIIFEMLAPKTPCTTYVLPKEKREKIIEYFKKFCIIDE
ncbi:MAG: hypothetical protein V1743_06595 [Nanoarchaeota archaeon]